ncbi:hypothetical protein [Streptomyces spongiae]|uniref:hypothetical protein n=1 Tax=Streptomyces spongiae TaxID=565072 RepID=UPI003899B163
MPPCAALLLLDAVLTIGTDLDLDVVLRRITESAVTLVDARYGALGVLGEEGKIRQFITVGMDEDTIRCSLSSRSYAASRTWVGSVPLVG